MDEREQKLLAIEGVTDVNSYMLVSNYGYTFKKNGHKYDIRYWANCYGCQLDEWRIRKCDNDDTTIIPKHDGTFESALEAIKQM